MAEAAIRYHISRKTVYKWLKRYDGTLASLEDKSHRPHHSPRAHTEEETALILKRLKRHGWHDLIVVYRELVERDGYTRSYGGFKRLVRRLREEPIKKRRKRKSKPYAKANYPGQKDGRKQPAVYQRKSNGYWKTCLGMKSPKRGT